VWIVLEGVDVIVYKEEAAPLSLLLTTRRSNESSIVNLA